MALLWFAIGAGIGGLISAVVSLVTHSRAERSLVEAIKKEDLLVTELRGMRAELESDIPDPKDVTRARQIVTSIARRLDERQRKNILGTLDQGSDKSKANYIVKLVEEVADLRVQD